MCIRDRPWSEAGRQAAATLALPRLHSLLGRLDRVALDTADECSLSPPHERALARALGLARENGTAFVAVSYTHLDVYKRQGKASVAAAWRPASDQGTANGISNCIAALSRSGQDRRAGTR